jgi:hypothetical protein
MGMDVQGSEFFANLRILCEVAARSRWHGKVLATRGERLALLHWRVVGRVEDAAGPAEVEYIGVVEVDATGRAVLNVLFDADALDAAYDELDERFAAGEASRFPEVTAAMRAFRQAFADRDWPALAAQLAPDMVVNDHRLLGWGVELGRETYIQAVRSLIDLAPDAYFRLDHVAVCARGYMVLTTWVGTRDGGAFESPSLVVADLDNRSTVRHFDQYDLEQWDEATRRFEALRSSAASDPLASLVQANAATAAIDRVQAAFDARDWPAMRAACAPDATFEDRRHHALISGDAEWWVADARGIAEATPDVSYRRRLVATAGPRVAIERVLWTGATRAGPVEVEYLRLVEVDDAGRIAAMIGFELEDWRAAHREAWNRWAAADPVTSAVIAPISEFVEALSDHDRVRMRAVLHDDLVVDDRRRVGQGVVEGADAYLDSLQVLWELAPDIQLERKLGLAHDRGGWVGI